MTNASGANVTLCNYAACILTINVPDRNGKLADVTLGYADLDSYIDDGPYFGKTCGRVANRIANGKFTLGGKEYTLPVNNGPNHLHGGPNGFANQLWNARIDGDKVVFSIESPDGAEGYPGNVKVEAAYSWNDDNELHIEYSGVTDAETVLMLTNHAYFNLAGENSGSVMNHTMKLEASRYLPTDDTLIPTGELAPVKGTPMDFTTAKTLGQDAGADFAALTYGKGYDACWAVDGWKKGVVKTIAELADAASGRRLVVMTDQPGVQMYTGNWLAGSPTSKSGRSYNDNDGVAIECQGFPDSPNHPAFPSVTLRPGEKYISNIIFRFEV